MLIITWNLWRRSSVTIPQFSRYTQSPLLTNTHTVTHERETLKYKQLLCTCVCVCSGQDRNHACTALDSCHGRTDGHIEKSNHGINANLIGGARRTVSDS